MKYLTIFFALATLSAPLAATAAIGADCSVNASACNAAAGEYCDTTSGYVCAGGGTQNTQTTSGAQTQTSGSSGFVPLAPIPGLTEGVVADSQGLASFFNNLYVFLIGFAAIAAVIEIIIGGMQYATTDNISHKSEGKARIQQAILGLVLVLMPVLVFSIINPKILNLSIGWSAIKVTPPGAAPTPLAPGAGGSSTAGVTAATPCNISGTYIQTATCYSPATQSAWETQCSSNNGTLILRVQNPATQTNCRVQNGQQVCDSVTVTESSCWHTLPGTFTVVNFGRTGLLGGTTYDFRAVDASSQPYLDFAASCKVDGGEVCRTQSQTACPSGFNLASCTQTKNVQPCLPTGGEGKCYQLSNLACKPLSAGGCF